MRAGEGGDKRKDEKGEYLLTKCRFMADKIMPLTEGVVYRTKREGKRVSILLRVGAFMVSGFKYSE